MAACTYKNNSNGKTFETEEELVNDLARDKSISEQYKPSSEGRFVDGGLEQELDRLEVLHTQIVSRIFNAYEQSRPKSKYERDMLEQDRSEGKITHDLRLEQLKNDIESLNDNDKKQTIFKYLAWAESTIPSISTVLDELIDEGDIPHELILRIKNKNAVYDLLGDVLAATEGADVSEAVKEGITRRVNKLNGVKKSIDAKILTVERQMYARMMTKNSNQHITQWRNHYGNKYDAIQPQTPKEEWIQLKMDENREAIDKKAYEMYLIQAEESISDLNAGMARLVSEKNLNSPEIQVASTMMDAADQETHQYAKSKALEIKDHHTNFAKGESGTNREEMYKKYVQQTEEGTYLHSEFSIDFMKEKDKVRIANSDAQSLQELYGDIQVEKNGLYKLDGKTFLLKINNKGAKKVVVSGDFLSYEIAGQTYTKKVVDVIGANVLARWDKANTQERMVNGIKSRVPNDNWKNKDYAKLSQEELNTLNEFKEYINEGTLLTAETQSLVERSSGATWHRLPGITRTTMSRVLAGDVSSAAIDKLTDAIKRKDDELDVQKTGTRNDNTIKVLADINNKEKMTIPTGNRAKLPIKDQSLDIHSLLLVNLQQAKNYEQKKRLESQILVMVDIMGERYVPKHRGAGKKQEVHSFSKIKDMKVFHSKSDLPADARTLLSIAENRLYGLKSKDAGDIAGVNIQKATKTVLKYAGSVSLIGNWMNSIVNATTGTMNNLVEAIGGESYTLSDWKKAGVTYWKDAKDIFDDLGTNVSTSRTNLLNNLFNTLGSPEALNNNFEDNTRLKSLFSVHSLRPIAQAGEHMMQSKVMYAIMNNIKVMNSKGQFLDREGNIVASKKLAASLDDVISFKNDGKSIETVIPDFVGGTTFSPGSSHEKILLETRGLIKKKIIDLHGNYDAELQSSAQREWWGKALFFLKKWMESTTLRRWRGLPKALKSSDELRDVDRFYSEDLKSYQEGYYVTAVRFTKHTLPAAMKAFNIALIKSDYNKMTTHEKGNIKRFLAEMGSIAVIGLAYAAMGGLDDDPDEDTLLARYFLRRELAELTFYSNPAEAIKIAKSPSAAINFTERITKVIGQLFSPTEMYDTGNNKGRSKLWVKTVKALPIGSQTEKDFEASLRFLQVME